MSVSNSNKFLAQAFSVATPGDVTGVYLTKIGLYFSKKGAGSNVRLSILEMKNGFPDRNAVIPNSVIAIPSDDVSVSTDASSETQFTFDSPVYLDSTKQYCFAVSTSSPDFTLWGATRGEKDVNTNKIVNNNPLTESAFYSESNAEYSELPSQDIKFTLYRAKFNTASAGVATLRNRENLDYIVCSNVSMVENLIPFTTDLVGTLNVPGSNKGKFVSMFRKEGSDDFLIVVETNSGNTFSVGEEIVLYREHMVDGTTYNTDLLNGTVTSIGAYEYHSVLPRLDVDKKPGSELALKMSGSVADGDSYNEDASFAITLNETAERAFSDKKRFLLSYSKESTILGGNASLQVQATLNTTNEYVAPIIRLDNSNVLLLSNIINNDVTDESTRDGLAKAKYISRVVSLADGMDAEDIKVYVDAYKPKNTNVYVYGKFQNSEDFSDFDSLPWIPLSQVTPEGVYSDPKDQTDFREFEFEIPATYKNADGYFIYSGTGAETGEYVRFKKYSIKIVLTTETDYEFNPPKITDLRVIALQK